MAAKICPAIKANIDAFRTAPRRKSNSPQNDRIMKSKYLIPTLAVICAATHVTQAQDAAIVTDPGKIVESTTYDLGNRLLTVQELTKEALPMPPPPPPALPSASTPRLVLKSKQQRGFLSVGATIYRRTGLQARTLIHYRPQGETEPIIFWSSADWSLIAGIGSLTASDGKIWQLMCMPSIYDLGGRTVFQRQPIPTIPDFPAGKSTYQIVSGNPTAEQMVPVNLFIAYYDAHLTELQASYQKRIDEQQRQAAEEKAHPKVPEDIVVQYRILAPEEIVTPEGSPTASEK